MKKKCLIIIKTKARKILAYNHFFQMNHKPFFRNPKIKAQSEQL